MIITYLVFGNNDSNFCQANFSILTFLAQKENNDTVAIVTDNPEKFNSLKKKVTVLVVNKETLTKWKGEYNFFWRIKIKALQLISSKFDNQHILYLDSDTFLFGNLNNIRSNLNDNKNLMHTKEGKLSEISSKTERLMWKQLKNQKYDQIEINLNTCMWNAGVIAISQKNINKLDQTLEICDQMCANNVTKRLIEQFAFSIAMNDSVDLLSVENEIGHYWGNKKMWNNKISEFINNCFMKNLSLEQQIEKVTNINFEDIPIRIKIPNTRKRLEKKLYRLFPDKIKVYITKANKV